MSGARLPRSAYNEFNASKNRLVLSTMGSNSIVATDFSAVSLRCGPEERLARRTQSAGGRPRRQLSSMKSESAIPAGARRLLPPGHAHAKHTHAEQDGSAGPVYRARQGPAAVGRAVLGRLLRRGGRARRGGEVRGCGVCVRVRGCCCVFLSWKGARGVRFMTVGCAPACVASHRLAATILAVESSIELPRVRSRRRSVTAARIRRRDERREGRRRLTATAAAGGVPAGGAVRWRKNFRQWTWRTPPRRGRRPGGGPSASCGRSGGPAEAGRWCGGSRRRRWPTGTGCCTSFTTGTSG